MEKIIIHSGFFFGAGSVYKWVQDGLHIHGIGIDLGLLLNNEQLEVTVKTNENNPPKIYVLDCSEALKQISKYNSIKIIKGVDIGIISKSLLRPKSEI